MPVVVTDLPVNFPASSTQTNQDIPKSKLKIKTIFARSVFKSVCCNVFAGLPESMHYGLTPLGVTILSHYSKRIFLKPFY